MDYKIIPAILTDDVDGLEDELQQIESVADIVQIDYVDGFFAPEITCCEAHVIKEVETTAALEIHLMVENPILQVQDWHAVGAERIVAQIEEMEDQLEFVELVSKLGMGVGLALALATPLDDLDEELIDGLDVVLLMAHEVGVQEVKLEQQVLLKVAELRAKHPNLNIEVDGGVNQETIADVIRAGANYLAIGSAIFESKDPVAEYHRLTKFFAQA